MTGERKRVTGIVGAMAALAVAAGVAVVLLGRPQTVSIPSPAAAAVPAPAFVVAWEDSFASFNDSRWAPTSAGDFKEKSVDVLDGRLRLRCGTIGTDDKTVKFLGTRCVQKIRLKNGTRISAEIDWNSQANGCYLSGGLVLAPVETAGNPLTTADWLKVEYVGVPPGRNGRLVVATRLKGREPLPYTEGWPQVRREGRGIALQKIELVVKDGLVEVWENGNLQTTTTEKITFEEAYLYLQMSSHSNYPPRDLFFDNVRVSAAP